MIGLHHLNNVYWLYQISILVTSVKKSFRERSLHDKNKEIPRTIQRCGRISDTAGSKLLGGVERILFAIPDASNFCGASG